MRSSRLFSVQIRFEERNEAELKRALCTNPSGTCAASEAAPEVFP